MKAVVAAFNQEKALVGAFSVITNLRIELFQALGQTRATCHAAHLTRLARGAEAVRVGGGGVAVAAARQTDALHARGVRGARGVGLGSRGVAVAAGGEGGLAGAVLAGRCFNRA